MRSATWWTTAPSPTPSRSIPQTLATQPLRGRPHYARHGSPTSARAWTTNSAQNNTLMFRYGITHSDVRDNGIGGFDLTSRGYHSQFTNQTVQAADTALIGTAVNETRFQFYRSATQAIANSPSPAILVLQSFNGGGSALGRTFDTQNSYELQNYTSMLKGTHSWRFGVRLRGQTDDSVSPQNFNGTFTFGGGGLAPVLDAQNRPVLDADGQPQMAPITSIERYRRTLLFQQLGDTPAQIRALGGGATQFSMSAGTAELAVHQMDVGIFAGDEWRVRPNFTLSLGLRYETQTNIHDWRDFAPRLAFAWAPGGSGQKRAKTVLRAGFGMFYDRFALANTLAAQRFNGLVQQQYVVPNPDFFPNVPSPATLAGFQSTQVIQEVSANAARAVHAAIGRHGGAAVARATRTMAVTYTNSHGLHLLRSEDINAPLPGTYNPAVPDSGVFPLGHPGPLELMESSGIYNQNQLIANVNAKLNAGLSLFGFYVFNHAHEQHRRHRHVSGESLQLRGRVRAGVHGRASSRHRRRLDQFEVGGAHQPVRGGANRRAVRHHGGQRSLRHHAVQRPAGHRDRSDKAGPDPDRVRAAGSEPDAGRAVALAQLRTRSGTDQRESADRQDDRLRQGARRSRRSASQRRRRAGRGAVGGKRPRFGRADRQPFHLAPLQPEHRAVDPQPAQPHQPGTDCRQHHLAVFRLCEPDRGRAERRRILRDGQQPPAGIADQVHVLGFPVFRISLAKVESRSLRERWYIRTFLFSIKNCDAPSPGIF